MRRQMGAVTRVCHVGTWCDMWGTGEQLKDFAPAVHSTRHVLGGVVRHVLEGSEAGDEDPWCSGTALAPCSKLLVGDARAAAEEHGPDGDHQEDGQECDECDGGSAELLAPRRLRLPAPGAVPGSRATRLVHEDIPRRVQRLRHVDCGEKRSVRKGREQCSPMSLSNDL